MHSIQTQLALLNKPVNRYQYALQLQLDNINEYACSVNRWLSAPTQVNAFYTPLFNKFGKIVKNIIHYFFLFSLRI